MKKLYYKLIALRREAKKNGESLTSLAMRIIHDPNLVGPNFWVKFKHLKKYSAKTNGKVFELLFKIDDITLNLIPLISLTFKNTSFVAVFLEINQHAKPPAKKLTAKK